MKQENTWWRRKMEHQISI